MNNSSITLDYSNCMSDRVGAHGIARSELDAAAPRLAEITADLAQTRGTGWERWRELPFEPMRSAHVEAVKALVTKHKPGTRNLIVLGIGGSALGNIALHAALNSHLWNLQADAVRNGPRLFVLDNVDPQVVTDTMTFIETDDPGFEHTLVNVISKSGETAETAAQFIILRDRLRHVLDADHANHIVAVTDPAKGTMRAICDDAGYDTLPVPDGVGGRFSVLSPVGLFSAAMCNIDIDALLDGAAAMDERCTSSDHKQNPAALLAWLLIRFASGGKPNHVLMPYCNAMYLMADWYRQLWAESLGKQHDVNGNEVFAGATPIKALGATDQHSQIQLYREGPHDKVIGLVEVGAFAVDATIPGEGLPDSLQYLGGSSLQSLLHAEQKATTFALTQSQRPNFTIRIPRLNAFAVGQFIQLWQVATAYAGRLLNIDAYNQPAVETGKQATFGLMGRAGYEQWQRDVEAMLRPTDDIA